MSIWADDALKVKYGSKTECEKDGGKDRLFPFTSISWYLTENIGGINRTYNTTVPLNRNDKTFKLNALMAGRFAQAEVELDRKVVSSKKAKTRHKATKGPVLPSGDLAISLLNLWSVNSTRWSITINGTEFATVIPWLYNVPAELVRVSASWKLQMNVEIIITSKVAF
eukprot:Gregarina_sp_Poly_1__7317@NODE_4023_length_774_cov_58_182461_g8_i4_p1_GENE_NODE_4023_length_774_cov_58_182461_g8_i4NODE_4023_length_774_cov_58_182461_g8_i4_p1_ORF_typecomplete_len168_score16_55_NODE_4023_length_774_cov_58_182461_g8_i491594